MKIDKFRKGSLDTPLTALVGTILSVLALYVLFSIFSNFVVTPENQAIAEQNAQSIVDFIDYIENSPKFSSIDSCYGMLSLERLQNYQYKSSKDENQDNYFLKIDSKSVSVYQITQLNDLITETDVNPRPIKTFTIDTCKNNDCKLYLDNTESSLLGFPVEMFFVPAFQGDDNLELEQLSPDAFITLVPNFDSQNSFKIEYHNIGQVSIYSTTDANGNMCIISAGTCPRIIVNEDKKVTGAYLIFDKSSNGLFITKSSLSEFYIQKDTCFIQDLDIRDYYSYYRANPLSVDSTTNDVDISYIGNEISFHWQGKAICKRDGTIVDCQTIDDLFSSSDSYSSYRDLVLNAIAFYREIEDEYEEDKLIINPKIISDEYFRERQIIPQFDDVFEVLTQEPSSEDKVSIERGWILTIKRDINNCNDYPKYICEFANNFYLIDNKAYFYLPEKEKYYSFNHFNLRQDYNCGDRCKLYYIGLGDKIIPRNNIKISNNEYTIIESLPVDDEGSIKYYDIILSPRQHQKIPRMSD